VALVALYMHLPEPASAHHMSQTACIIAIGLVAHGRKRASHMPCFDNYRRKTPRNQLIAKPW